jgi:hypothetical protein
VLSRHGHHFVLAVGAFLREISILISVMLASMKNRRIPAIDPVGDTWEN